MGESGWGAGATDPGGRAHGESTSTFPPSGVEAEGGEFRPIAVVPVEQKRTKAGGWTKGREVASYHLARYPEEAADFLTDQDRAALAGFAMRRDYYYGDGYDFDSGLILRALIGHPYVFWEDHPHVPVEIVEGKPEVHIVPKGGLLYIRMDPYPDSDADGYLTPELCHQGISGSRAGRRV